MNSKELLRRLASAPPDDPLWNEFFKRCKRLTRASAWWAIWAARHRGSTSLDDAAQEVMARLLVRNRRGLVRFTGSRKSSLEGYIRRIAENVLRDQLRSDWTRVKNEQTLAPDEEWRLEEAAAEAAADGDANDPTAPLEERETNEDIERVLRQMELDPRQRALNRLLFRRYVFDGFSIPQIARMRSVPLSASSVARRLKLIRKAFQESDLKKRRYPGDTHPPRTSGRPIAKKKPAPKK